MESQFKTKLGQLVSWQMGGWSSIAVQDAQKINYALQNSECTFNKTELIKMMLHDGFGETNFEELYAHMNKIVVENC